jgi:hypothetical protein
MARSSEAAGDAVAARKEYATFVAAWKDADSGMPQVEHAREYVAGEKALASVRRGGMLEVTW